MGTRTETPAKAIRAAREVAHAASYLASEAASLARVFEPYAATEESAAASQAAIRAAKSAFEIDEVVLLAVDAPPSLTETLRQAKRSLDAAAEAVAAANDALGKATAMTPTGSQTGVGAS